MEFPFLFIRLWVYGHEIGVGVSMPDQSSISVQRYAQMIESVSRKITSESKIEYIHGARHLGLTKQENYYKAIYELDVWYDSSLHITHENKSKNEYTYPYVMHNNTVESPLVCPGKGNDNGDNDDCPKQDMHYDEQWQVPVLGFLDEDGNVQTYVRDLDDLRTEDWVTGFQPQVGEILYNATLRHFDNNERVPLMFNFDIKDLQDEYLLEGVNEYLDNIHKQNDIWVVTIKQMMDWVLNPVRLGLTYRFGEWKCEARMKDKCHVRGLDPDEDNVNDAKNKGNPIESLNITNIFPGGYYLVYWQTGLLLGTFFLIIMYDKYA